MRELLLSGFNIPSCESKPLKSRAFLWFNYKALKTNNLRKISAGIILLFLVAVISLIAIYYLRKGISRHAALKNQRGVVIEEQNGRFRFLKDGQPFLIKGGAGYSFMPELSACGGNTIICWDTSKLATTLEAAEKNNLSVIIGLDMPDIKDFDFYKDERKVMGLYTAYRRIVTACKDQHAMFAWCLGNELSFPYSPKWDLFYSSYSRVLDMIHDIDPAHPVFTTVINMDKKKLFNIQWRIPALDFVGINVYNSIRNFKQEMDFIKIFWKGPYIISEWAPRGGWEAPLTSWQAPIEESSTVKAQQYLDFFKKYMPVQDERFLGSMAYYWGNRQEYTYTYYSVFNDDGTPTEIKESLNDAWKDTVTVHHAPAVTAIVIDDSLQTKDNILFAAGSSHSAIIELKKASQSEKLQYSWQILKESWATWGATWVDFKKPVPETNLIAENGKQQIVFSAPLKEGPYRIFVTVFNSNGYCATANMPFYVIQ